MQGRREDLEKQVQKLDCEVVELESREIDAEIIRRNLGSFSGFYTKLTPPQQKELLALLVAEIVYDTQASKMKLTLRPIFLLHRLVQNTLLDRLGLIDLLRMPKKKLQEARNMGPQLCLQF